MTDPAEYLYSLPETVQARLVELVREIGDTSDQEKVDALAALDKLFVHLWNHGPWENQRTLALVSAVAQLVADIYRAEAPKEEVA